MRCLAWEPAHAGVPSVQLDSPLHTLRTGPGPSLSDDDCEEPKPYCQIRGCGNKALQGLGFCKNKARERALLCLLCMTVGSALPCLTQGLLLVLIDAQPSRRLLVSAAPGSPPPTFSVANFSSPSALDGSGGAVYVVASQLDPRTNATGEGWAQARAAVDCSPSVPTQAAASGVICPAGAGQLTPEAAEQVPKTVEQLNAAFYLGQVRCAAEARRHRIPSAAQPCHLHACRQPPACEFAGSVHECRMHVQTGELQDLWNTLTWVAIALAGCVALHAIVR